MRIPTVKRLLVVEAGGIGDLVMATPVFRAIRDYFYEAEIHLWIVERCKLLLHALPCFDHVYTTPDFAFKTAIQFALRLHTKRFDLLLDLEGIGSKLAGVKRAVLFKIITPRLIAGRDTNNYGFYLDVKAPEAILSRVHEVERKLSIIEALGINVADKSLEFAIPHSAEDFIRGWIKDRGITATTPLAGLHPGGFRPSRRWSKENFGEIAKRLCQNYQVILTGSSGEGPLLQEVAEKAKNCKPILAYDLNLVQLGALMKKFRLFITNDTGPMHIAAALRIPIVAIFGPENPYQYGPYGTLSEVVFKENVPCRPCYRFVCHDHQCLKDLSLEEVWAKVEKLRKRVGI